MDKPVDKPFAHLTGGIGLRKTVTALIAGCAGLLFVSSHVTAEGTNLRSGGVEDLRGLVVDRARNTALLEAKVNSLESRVQTLTVDRITPELATKLKVLEEKSGLTAATGSAVQVTLTDAPRKPGDTIPDGVSADDLVVHQQDVQSVINAFWRGGATAIQVMDQRIVSTSAIRCVGNTLLLQGRVYSPPFVVTAIGRTAQLQQALSEEPGVILYREYVSAFGLGWQEKMLSQVTVPAWQGLVTN